MRDLRRSSTLSPNRRASPWRYLLAGAVGAALLPLACTDGVTLDPGGCDRGYYVVCHCEDGELGIKQCSGRPEPGPNPGADDRYYGPCECKSPGPTTVGTTTGAGSTSSSSTSSGGSGGGGADPGSYLESGDEVLVDAFIGEAGIYVVLEFAVKLVDRTGVVLQQVDYAREITTAAFDGTYLVVADKAMFTTYDSSLSKVVEAPLLEECASAVLISGPRFVCGPGND